MLWRCLRQTDKRNHISGPRELKGYYALVKQQQETPKVTGSQVTADDFIWLMPLSEHLDCRLQTSQDSAPSQGKLRQAHDTMLM